MLIRDLHGLMHASEADMTLSFRALAEIAPFGAAVANRDDDRHADTDDDGFTRCPSLRVAFYSADKRDAHAGDWSQWLRRYALRLAEDDLPSEARSARMRVANPVYVLRNYLAQQAIDRAEQGDLSEVHTLLDLLRRPYEPQPGREAYAALRPDWARERVGCSMLSCSS